MADQPRSSSVPKISLRPEARPFTRNSLTESQRQIFDKVVSLLQDALTQLDQNQKEAEDAAKFPTRLQPQTRRINPVIMVSGGRGTGKTSLLLTLQREVILPQTGTSANATGPLADLRQRIVWLETLDLEPMPQSTGLMAAMVARIEQAVTEDAETDDLCLRRAQRTFGKVLQDLSDFSLDVCLAWDQDYPRLGDSGDTDLYARERMRVERARTNLQTRFAKLLNDLAATTPWKSDKQRPLFVLPVDDIDLNPARCLELLRLVRSFQTPRFVVLLFGDYEVARFVVNLSFLKEFGDLLPDHVLGTDTIRANIDGQAFRLGAEAIRKMLPPNQRFRLKNVSVGEVLGFPKEDGVETIGALLGKIAVPFKLHLSGAELSLAKWVADGSPWPAGTAPSAGLAFATTPRKLADLRIRLEELTSGETDSGFDLRLMSSVKDVSAIPTAGKRLVIVAAVGHLLHFRIFDHDGKMVVDTDATRRTAQAPQIEDLRKQLANSWPPHELTTSEKGWVIDAVTSIVGHTPDSDEWLNEFIATLWIEFQRGLVEDGVVTGPNAQNEVDYAVDAELPDGPFQLKFTRTPEIESEIPSPRASRLRLCWPAQPRLEGRSKPELTTGPPTPQSIGRAVLLHDLMRLTNATAFRPLVVPDVKSLELVRIDWRLEVGGTACSVAWPAPRFKTTWELELFLAHWARYRSRLSDSMLVRVSKEDLMPTITFWLALCGAFAFQSAALWDIVERSVTSADDFLEDVVKEYASQVTVPSQSAQKLGKRPAADLAQPPSAPPRATDWLLRTAAFLSPECYINKSAADAFYSNLELQAFWSQPLRKQVVQDHRKQSVTNLNALIAHALLSPAEYPEAVSFLLERARYLADKTNKRVSSDKSRFSDITKSEIRHLIDELKNLIDELKRTLPGPPRKRVSPRGAIPKKAPRDLAQQPWISDDAFSKQLISARNLLERLRLASKPRLVGGRSVLDNLDAIEKRLFSIEDTLTLWRDSEQHPVNRFNGGEFCPDLSRDEVIA
jgi:hypothetical protein